MLDARSAIGTHDLLFITFDTLRYDVAAAALERGDTPNLAAILPDGRWERRHTPANFTYAAHQSFFAGFLPTPTSTTKQPRIFALAFEGSETTTEETAVFDAPDIVRGLAEAGYHTLCIGGVGFFNKQNRLGNVLPGMFDESHWRADLGVTDPDSTRNQVTLACERIAALPNSKRLFLFLNVSALHQPNRMYLTGAAQDSRATHAAALAYVDAQLPPLFAAMRRRAPVLCILCSDHGTAYGEDGYVGHRLAHPCVWEVPYAELFLSENHDGSSDRPS